MRNPVGPYFIYRISRFLFRCGIPIFPKILDVFIRIFYSCVLPHSVEVGRGLVLGYDGLGVVIHKHAKLGNNVHVDQHVTIGGNARVMGVPVVESNVYLGAGCKILGPVRIGEGSVVGANAVVISDVPPRSVVVGVPGKVVKKISQPGDYLLL